MPPSVATTGLPNKYAQATKELSERVAHHLFSGACCTNNTQLNSENELNALKKKAIRLKGDFWQKTRFERLFQALRRADRHPESNRIRDHRLLLIPPHRSTAMFSSSTKHPALSWRTSFRLSRNSASANEPSFEARQLAAKP